MATTSTTAKKPHPASAAKTSTGVKAAAKKPAPATAAAKKPVAAKAPAKKTVAAAAKKPAPKRATATGGKLSVTPEQRYSMVAEAAYYRAQQQGFMGDPVSDWTAAEAEIAALLSGKK